MYVKKEDYKLLFAKKVYEKYQDNIILLEEYKGSKNKIKCKCYIHGDFFINGGNILNNKYACPKCSKLQQNKDYIKNHRITNKQFIELSKLYHSNFYDYSLLGDLNDVVKDIVEIICPIHGSFKQNYDAHCRCGKGCRFCANNENKSTPQFILESKKTHDSKYTYEKTNYINAHTEVIITCPVHGDFSQIARVHLRGNGCNKCNESKGEHKIRKWLEINNIKYTKEKRFTTDKFIIRRPFDFYLDDYNICIEYDGVQHYNGYWLFSYNENEKIKNLEQIQKSDNIKNKYCYDNNIKLIRIPYWDYERIEEILEKEIRLDKP